MKRVQVFLGAARQPVRYANMAKVIMDNFDRYSFVYYDVDNTSPLRLVRCFCKIPYFFMMLKSDVVIFCNMTVPIRYFKIASFFGKKIITDFYISMYDTNVTVKKLYGPDSREAKAMLEWDRYVISHSDKVIFLNKTEMKRYLDIAGVKPNRSYVLPLFNDEKMKAHLDYWNNKSQDINFCWWGKEGNPIHGLPVIIEALKKVEDQGYRFNLFLFGTDEKLGNQYFRDILDKVGWTEKIHPIYGFTFTNGKLTEFLAEKASIAFGLMSDDDKATQVIANKSLDAINAGIPVVTVDSVAMREYFDDTCVYYCRGNDSDALAATIIGILKSPKVSVLDKVAAAQNSFQKNFSTVSLQKKFLQILDD